MLLSAAENSGPIVWIYHNLSVHSPLDGHLSFQFLLSQVKPLGFVYKSLCGGGGGLELLSHVQLFAAAWTVARQPPLSMGFSRQEYCSGFSFPLQEIFLTQESCIPGLQSPALQAGSLPLCRLGNSSVWELCYLFSGVNI